MSDKTSIEWTRGDDGTPGATWNPVTGCTKVSPGCDHCYAERIVERFKGKGAFATVKRSEEKLYAPLHWRKPRRVFVNSMSDLFHDDVPTSFIARVFSVMARTPRHSYQLLTKRHARMRSLLGDEDFTRHVWLAAGRPASDEPPPWPLSNVWLGVSVEDQKWADIRVPALLGTPAAVRFLSCEPLLGPLDASEYLTPDGCHTHMGEKFPTICQSPSCGTAIDWAIVGGESGPGARPMHPDWARSLRDQCNAANVPFFFKQWGEWAPNGWRGIGNFHTQRERLVGKPLDDMGHHEVIERVGKKAAGRLLDGREWSEYPA